MEITNDMLTSAMKAAVQLRVFPKYSSESDYLAHWDAMKHVLEAALQPIALPDPHEIWAVAQLMPGEGIEDGVRRISEIVGAGEEE